MRHLTTTVIAGLICTVVATGYAQDKPLPNKPQDVGDALDLKTYKNAALPRIPMELPDRPLAKLEPKEGIYHGVLINTDTRELFEKEYKTYVDLVGHKPSLIGTFDARYNGGKTYPKDTLISRLKIIDTIPGVVPFVRTYLGDWDGKGPFMKADDILSGKEDTYLKDFARQAKEFGKPFFLSINHEMNGDWYAFSELYKRQPTDYTAEKFKLVWRYVHSLFQKEGATNIVYVFSPSFHAKKLGKYDALESHRAYYPGDEYVDWVGGSYYNNMQPYCVDDVALAYPNKPLMLAEWATKLEKSRWFLPKPYPGDAWFMRKTFEILPNRYPNLKAFAYFQWTPESKLERDPKQVEEYRKGISNPRFIHAANDGK